MDLKSFFEHEVKPALGCTEPGAVAYAASVAAKRLDGPPRHIHLRLSANVYKNGASVGIPGTDGLRGNLMAAALGAFGGDPDKGLQALENLTDSAVSTARAMVEAGQVTQEVQHEAPKVYAEVEMLRQGESATAIVAHQHDNLVEIRQNGQTVHFGEDCDGATGIPSYLRDLVRLSFEELWTAAGDIDGEIEKFLLTGVKMNMDVAKTGMEAPWGLAVGYARRKELAEQALELQLKAWTAAAADVRMAGGAMPVMSSAGSGNHGLTAIIPPAILAEKLGKSERELAEALALSHLVTGAVKAKIGRLTPICGCAVAAGAGAAAALARLMGGTPLQGESAVNFVISSVMGMICDGAKATCALKVSTAAGEAYSAAQLALDGRKIETQEGIIGPEFTTNTTAVGELCKIGFAAVDGTILRLINQYGLPC